LASIGLPSDLRPSNIYSAGDIDAAHDLMARDEAVSIGLPEHNTAIDTADYGVTVSGTNNTFVLISKRSSGADQVSVATVADVEAAAIDADHKIGVHGWYDNTGTFHESWSHKDASFESAEASIAELLGTETDGGASVGTRVGSVEDFVTDGAKLFSVVNNETEERAYIEHNGAFAIHKYDHGQELKFDIEEELVTVGTGSSTYAVFVIPSGSQVSAISSYVVSDLPDSNTYSIGVTGAEGRYGAAIGAGPGASHHGMDDGIRYYGASTNIVVTPSPAPSAATGTIRLTVHYIKTTPCSS
jgi:hypothetical protein